MPCRGIGDNQIFPSLEESRPRGQGSDASILETGCQPHHDAPRWTNGVSGKEAPKIDDIYNVGKILPVDLKPDIPAFRLVDVDPH